jgi:hypothetical protein
MAAIRLSRSSGLPENQTSRRIFVSMDTFGKSVIPCHLARPHFKGGFLGSEYSRQRLVVRIQSSTMPRRLPGLQRLSPPPHPPRAFGSSAPRRPRAKGHLLSRSTAHPTCLRTTQRKRPPCR